MRFEGEEVRYEKWRLIFVLSFVRFYQIGRFFLVLVEKKKNKFGERCFLLSRLRRHDRR